MKYNLRVIPNARQNKIIEEENRFKVYLTAPPAKGRANQALVEFLAQYFKIKKKQIKILRGEKNRDKIIEINPAAEIFPETRR